MLDFLDKLKLKIFLILPYFLSIPNIKIFFCSTRTFTTRTYIFNDLAMSNDVCVFQKIKTYCFYPCIKFGIEISLFEQDITAQISILGVGISICILNIVFWGYGSLTRYWLIDYMITSFTGLPWTSCNNTWNTNSCISRDIAADQYWNDSITNDEITTRSGNTTMSSEEEFWQYVCKQKY